jgi:hypothetical protein
MTLGHLATLLDWDAIVELAGPLYLRRGMQYVEVKGYADRIGARRGGGWPLASS